MPYEAVVGLEVHLQLATTTKLFCGCPTRFGAPPNSQACPVCLGLPGVLPVFNERALEWGIRAALAFECEIAEVMKFDRKQYFYPDLPKNYQISQYDQPLARHGRLDLVAGGAARRIRIRRIHLEEDAGKLLHEGSPTSSFVDFNRAGVPLLEIVSEPDLRTPEEATQYLLGLKAIIQYLDVSTCNMEEGSLRCDTNISLRPLGSEALGVKVEIKNLNSFKAVRLALEHETRRQALALDRGERLVQETRLWDAKAQRTEPMRSKEEAADYRYFPEPDLVPFVIDRAVVRRIREGLPELPAQRRARFETRYQLSAYDAGVLSQSRALGELFEGAVRLIAKPKAVANWIMGELLAHLNARALEPEGLTLPPEWLAHLLQLMDEGTLSGKMAKEVFQEMLTEQVDPAELVRARGLRQITDDRALERVADEVVRTNARSVEAYLGGKATAFTHLMGQAMKQTKGAANPQQMAEALRRRLERLKAATGT